MKGKIFAYSLLFIALGAIFWGYKNSDFVFEKIGDYYYKKNDITNAGKYYEKSFEKGNKNSSIRETYVNLIINSPLTVESQKKLVDIAEGSIHDEAFTKAKYFLYDLKREIHNSYPDNYIKQAPYNRQIIRWNKFPITYCFKNSENIPSYYIEEINKAFAEWEKADVVLFSETKGKADITISFKPAEKQKIEYGRKYVIASTFPQTNSDKLQGMTMIFHVNDPEGNLFSKNQIYNTALHEIFHAMGFIGHSFNSENIMYMAKDSSSLQKDIRAELTKADINTLKLLYKIEPDITNDRTLASKYIPYLVLGDDEEVNLSKAREAKNYIYHAPTLPSGYIDLAESYVAQKRYAAAIKSLEKALDISSDDEMRYIIYYDLAVVYNTITNTEMALDYLEKAMELKDSEELHFLKAEILYKTDSESAKKEYIDLIKNYPDNADYTLRLANLYLKDKNYLGARSVLKSFLKRNPKMRDDKRFRNFGILIF